MDDTITITRDEYEALLSDREELAELQAYDRAIARDEESVPSEFVDRMLAGESLLKLWREHRGLSQSKLAQLSGVNRVQIGDIESRGKTGSVETYKKLAAALNLDIDDLV